MSSLVQERRDLLTGLLGPDWEVTYPPPTLPPLTGPVLSALPPEVQQAVQEIAARGQQRVQRYIESREKIGRIPDPTELARLRRQTRDELGRILTADQLEEYLIRYSNTAARLRADLHDFDASPDEFRRIFRVRDQIDSQIEMLYSGDDPASSKRRRQLENQREAGLKQEMGLDRYATYKANQDPSFREAQALAEKLKASPDTVIPLYEINRTSELERLRIRSDTSMSNDERTAALQSIQLEQEKTLRRILGDEAYERYQRSKDASPSQ